MQLMSMQQQCAAQQLGARPRPSVVIPLLPPPSPSCTSACSAVTDSWPRHRPWATSGSSRCWQHGGRAPPTSMQTTTRAMRPSSSSSISRSILSVVKDEQKYALESYRKDEELLEDPPNEFDLDATPGLRVVYLLKAYRDEQIVIDMDLDDQQDQEDALDDSDDEDEEDADLLPPVTFRVQINKPKAQGVLTFRCISNGEYLNIQELSLHTQGTRGSQRDDEEDEDEEEEFGDDDDDDEAYAGPPFDELDDTLQQAFMDYLEERGITAELGRYLALTALDKAATEYQAWLDRVSKFIAS